MNTEDRFERELPGLLHELYPVRAPDYRDDLVARVSTVPQRWTWSAPALRSRGGIRLRWVIALGVIAALVTTAALVGANIVDRRDPRLPWVIAQGKSLLLASSDARQLERLRDDGPYLDPQWSPSGRYILATRVVGPGDPAATQLVVLREDGTEVGTHGSPRVPVTWTARWLDPEVGGEELIIAGVDEPSGLIFDVGLREQWRITEDATGWEPSTPSPVALPRAIVTRSVTVDGVSGDGFVRSDPTRPQDGYVSFVALRPERNPRDEPRGHLTAWLEIDGGRAVAFASATCVAMCVGDLGLIDTTTGTPTYLSAEADPRTWLSTSPEGRYLLATADDASNRRVPMLFPIDGGPPVPLVRDAPESWRVARARFVGSAGNVIVAARDLPDPLTSRTSDIYLVEAGTNAPRLIVDGASGADLREVR